MGAFLKTICRSLCSRPVMVMWVRHQLVSTAASCVSIFGGVTDNRVIVLSGDARIFKETLQVFLKIVKLLLMVI